MRTVSRSKFALSEEGGYMIRSTVWIALVLALAGTAVDSTGSLRWESLFSGTETASAVVIENDRFNGAGAGATTTEFARTRVRHGAGEGSLRAAAGRESVNWLAAPPKPAQKTPEPLPVPDAHPADREAVIGKDCAGIAPRPDHCQDEAPQVALPTLPVLGLDLSHISLDPAR